MTTHLVTGANRGIGLEFARRLRAAGHPVIATARDPESAAALRSTGARVEHLDAADPDSVRRLAERLADTPVDVLINNAAVFVDHPKTSCMQTTADDLLTTYRVNVAGPLLMLQAFAPHLERSARKLVVHVSSDYGSIAQAARSKGRGHLAYRSSKAALNMVHVLSAHELADRGITAVAIHPGWVQTDMGGPNATLTVQESVSSMLGVIARLTPADNASFVSYDGSPLAW